MLEIVDTSIVNVALNDMQNAFGATLTQVSWVVSSYAVANVIILPLSAWLGMRFGRKRYFVWSLIGFTVASALCGMATNLVMLIVARVIQGIAGGGLLAKAQAILFETFPKEEQAAAQGFFVAIVIAGPTIGPTLGGYITTNIGWRWIFYVNLPVGVAAVMMCMAFLQEDDPHAHKEAHGAIDWWTIALLAIGLGTLQTVLEEGNADDWFKSPFILAMTAATVVGLVLFVYRSLTAKQPIVDLRVLRYRSLWSGSILSIVVGMPLYGAIFAVPVFAQSVLGFTSQQTGMLLSPGALASAVAMPIVSVVMKKMAARVMLVLGGLVLGASILWLGQLSPQAGVDQLFWPLIMRSFGSIMMFLPLSLAALGPIPKEDISKASGIYNLTRQLGGSIGVAILSTMLEKREAFHRAVLMEKLGAIDPSTLERVRMYAARFLAMGETAADATAHAYKLLDGAVNTQAAVMSFGDTFWATAVLVVSTLPLVFLLGKPQQGVAVDAGH